MALLRNWVMDQSDQKLVSIARGDLTPYFADDSRPSGLKANNTDDVYIAIYDANGNFNTHNWTMHADEEWPEIPASLTSPTVNSYNATGFRVFELQNSDGTERFRAVVLLVQVGDSTDIQPAIIALSMSDSERLLQAYLAIYLGLGLAVVVIGALLTRMLVTNTFAPLREVERTAAAIAEGDFSQRLTGDDSSNTEVSHLNRSLNTMLSRIDTALSDRARTIDQMRRFVGDASHELRTPLVSVRGYAELYRMGALQSPEDVAGAMERIEKEAIRMSGLVEDLLELARLDEARPLDLAPVDLVPLARDAALDTSVIAPDRIVTLVAPLAGTAAANAAQETVSSVENDSSAPSDAASTTPTMLTGPIALAGAAFSRLRGKKRDEVLLTPESEDILESAAEAGVPGAVDLGAVPASSASELRAHPFAEGAAVVMADENKLRQVLSNLVSNALRYTPEGSPLEIRVSIDMARERAEIDLVDHGEGIPPQIREKVFQRFWRSDTSRARETGGSGLGLAIVASIVSAHNGTVDVSETPGGGATFSISLPLAGTAAAPRGVAG